MKRCGTCKEIKPLDMFYNMKSNRIDGKASRCKPCDLEARRKWTDRNPERQLRSQRSRNLKHYFGITIEDYDRMVVSQNGKCAICGADENKAGRVSSRTNGFVVIPRFSVDHCHKTGRIRGLLCNQCNRGIGMLGDNVERIEKVISYLRYEMEFQQEVRLTNKEDI